MKRSKESVLEHLQQWCIRLSISTCGELKLRNDASTTLHFALQIAKMIQ